MDWSTFTKKIEIPAGIKKVYDAWTQQELIEKWFLKRAHYFDSNKNQRKKDEPVLKGDKYEWDWHNYEHTETGEYLKANGKDNVRFTFGRGGTVDISLKELSSNRTLLTLTQSDMDTDEKTKYEIYVGCSNGWTFWLANLRAYLEFGKTLHETEMPSEGISNSVNN